MSLALNRSESEPTLPRTAVPAAATNPGIRKPLPFDLYLITESDTPDGVIEGVTAALQPPIPPDRIAVQLRAKSWPLRDLAHVGHQLRAITRRSGVSLILNGPLQLAHEIGADGVQLPEDGPSVADARQQLGQRALIGRSCHDLAGIRESTCCGNLLAGDGLGADFVTLSPYFSVPGKGQPLTNARAASLCRASNRPVFALGGIDLSRIDEVIAGGAWGVAVIRSVFSTHCPAAAVRKLVEGLDHAKTSPGAAK